MPIPKSLCDREMDKFCEDSEGRTAVRVCTDNEAINVTGTFVQAAVGPIKITGETVTATSAEFPTAANQANRAAFSVRNVDASQSVWVVNSTGITKAAAGDDIWEIGPNETLNLDFDDTNKITLVADTGQSVKIQVLEIRGTA